MIKHITYLGFMLLTLISCNNVNSLHKELIKMSNDLNKDCPWVIDEYTTLSSTVVVNKSFMYIYKVKYGLFEEFGITKSDWKKNQNTIIKNIYCTDPDMLWFKSNNIPVTWSYEYLDGSHIGKITIHSDDC